MDKHKYHLKKIEPVKNRYLFGQKPTTSNFKIEKASTIISKQSPINKMYNQPKKQDQVEQSQIIDEYKPLNINKEHSHQMIFENYRPVQSFLCLLSNSKNVPSQKFKNLSFKPQTKLQQQNGCKCAYPCLIATQMIQLININTQQIKEGYNKFLAKLKQLKQKKNAKNIFKNPLIQKIGPNLTQIKKDLERTQPQHEVFRKVEWMQKMERILACFCIADIQVGYIQGMNIILSGIIYHVKDEAKSFSIFWRIIEIARSIYVNDFQKCENHAIQIKKILKKMRPKLFEHIESLDVQLSIMLFPWFLSLLTCVVPLQYLDKIYKNFLKLGWSHIYRLSISIILFHEQQVLFLKQSSDFYQFFGSNSQKHRLADWNKIFSNCSSLKF